MGFLNSSTLDSFNETCNTFCSSFRSGVSTENPANNANSLKEKINAGISVGIDRVESNEISAFIRLAVITSLCKFFNSVNSRSDAILNVTSFEKLFCLAVTSRTPLLIKREFASSLFSDSESKIVRLI
ncbi:MAG: hypothetical protein ISR78_09380 [Spirochaetia bacterium]|nr:hypothetical protein [Spirochaetia bacterium]